MTPSLPDKTFTIRIDENIAILGDETLIEHALWSLFTCAAALSPQDTPAMVALSLTDSCANLSVDLAGTSLSIPDIEELFMPFRSMKYEDGSGIRSTVGLYLCREIVRLHNGRLHVRPAATLKPEFLMELPV